MKAKKDYIIVKDRHPRISEVLNDCISLCVSTCKNEPLSSILQKICAKLTNVISDVAVLEGEVDELQAEVCPALSTEDGNIIECRDDGLYVTVEIPEDVPLRFGVSGEDDTATENRAFNSTGFTFDISGLPNTETGYLLMYNPGNGRITYHDYFATLTVDETKGLQKSGTQVNLGGNVTGGFVSFTVGTSSGFTIAAASGLGVFQVSNSGNGSCYNATANGASGNGITIATIGGSGVQSTATTGTPLFGISNPATTTGSQNVLRLDRLSSGTATDGIAGAIEFRTEVSTGLSQVSSRLISTMTTVNSATRTSSFSINNVLNAVEVNNLILTAAGAFTLTAGLGDFADDTAAAGGGIALNQLYRNGSVVQIRVT